MLRQIKREVQDGLIIKNGVLPVTTSAFRKFCFLRISYKELISYLLSRIPTATPYMFKATTSL